ncbi:MAG: hypothetical protein WBA42_13255 [Mesorhizobium sp.]
MAQAFESVDWSQELKNLVETAKTPDEQKSATAFANAIGPYLDNPEMLRTLLGKIMQSPTETVAIVAGEKDFATLEDVQRRVGNAVSVVAL